MFRPSGNNIFYLAEFVDNDNKIISRLLNMLRFYMPSVLFATISKVNACDPARPILALRHYLLEFQMKVTSVRIYHKLYIFQNE